MCLGTFFFIYFLTGNLLSFRSMAKYIGIAIYKLIHIAVIIVGLLFILDIKVKKPQNPVRILLVAVVALALAKMFRLI